MTPLDHRHGTSAGYVAGCRNQCCRDAIAAWTRHRRTRLYLHGPLMVDGTGTRRRIRALMALGWSCNTLDEMVGRRRTYSVNLVNRTGPIRRDTAALYADVYERLSMTPPPFGTHFEKVIANRTRNYAKARGWLPPLAYDDIDRDPDPTPERRRPGAPDKQPGHVEDLEWLANAGESLHHAADRLGLQVETVREVCRRSGRMDLWARLGGAA